MMVLDVLRLISDDEKKNIYTYLLGRMRSFDGARGVYKELTRIRSPASSSETSG